MKIVSFAMLVLFCSIAFLFRELQLVQEELRHVKSMRSISHVAPGVSPDHLVEINQSVERLIQFLVFDLDLSTDKERKLKTIGNILSRKIYRAKKEKLAPVEAQKRLKQQLAWVDHQVKQVLSTQEYQRYHIVVSQARE